MTVLAELISLIGRYPAAFSIGVPSLAGLAALVGKYSTSYAWRSHERKTRIVEGFKDIGIFAGAGYAALRLSEAAGLRQYLSFNVYLLMTLAALIVGSIGFTKKISQLSLGNFFSISVMWWHLFQLFMLGFPLTYLLATNDVSNFIIILLICLVNLFVAAYIRPSLHRTPSATVVKQDNVEEEMKFHG